MPALTLKSIPDDLLQRLRNAARIHRRSLNSEVLELLDRALPPPPEDPAVTFARLDALRKKWKFKPHTDEEIQAAKIRGRR
jgi:plasmid stability protein